MLEHILVVNDDDIDDVMTSNHFERIYTIKKEVLSNHKDIEDKINMEYITNVKINATLTLSELETLMCIVKSKTRLTENNIKV